MENKLARYGILAWVGLNLLDLASTVLIAEASGLGFKAIEKNLLVSWLPYPGGFIFYKLALTVILAINLYIISGKYKKFPVVADALLVTTWTVGVLV